MTTLLLVARLTANGALDSSFGMGGIYIASAPGGFGGYPAALPALLAAATAYGPWPASTGHGRVQQCSVVGLTDTGALDAGVRFAGIAAAPSTSEKGIDCKSLAVQSDGKLLLGRHG